MSAKPKIFTGSGTSNTMPSIIQAAYRRDQELVAKLLIDGANVNDVDPEDHLTCLHIACMNGDDAIVDVILNWDKSHQGVDFDIKSKYRPRLAWQYAMNSHHYEIARKVLAASKRSRGLFEISPP